MTGSLYVYLACCTVASFTDLRWRRVPNFLTYGAIAIVIALSATGGIVSMLWTLAAVVATILAGSFIHGVGWLGGGDIKLLAVGAGVLGFPAFFIALLYTTSFGGVLAIMYALRERRLGTVITNVALSAISATNVTPATGSRRIPYAVAICAGLVFSTPLRKVSHHGYGSLTK